MQDTNKTKEMILEFLQTNGPSLPIQISKHIKMDSLFTSAFLSELLREHKIKLSHMKVGTSPIYMIPGTEKGMEKYIEYLKGKEKEALNLLKENKFLEDTTQHPAYRIALRQTKDFAIPFKLNDKIIWRYFTIPAQEYLKQKTEEKKEEPIQEQPKTKPPISSIPSAKETISKNKDSNIQHTTTKPAPIFKKENQYSSFINPLATKIETKKEETIKPEFCQKIINMIQKNNWQTIEEIECKKKEYNALIQVNSDLGPIIFKLQAKDKKTVGESDLSKLLGEAQSIPLPALFMSYGEIKKKAQEFLSKYISVIKYKQIK
jgi:hypothetical protein